MSSRPFEQFVCPIPGFRPSAGSRAFRGPIFLLAFVLVVHFQAAGQTGPSAGAMPSNANYYYPVGPSTIIDFGSPAREGLFINRVTLNWASTDAVDCTNSFRVKILRPSPEKWGAYATALNAGPFTPEEGFSTVDVEEFFMEAGDVLAVTLLRPTSECGSPRYGASDRPGAILIVPGDVPASGTLANAQIYRDGVLAARATWNGYALEGAIPLIGAAPGNNGSFFRTSMQLTNPTDLPLETYLEFWPANTERTGALVLRAFPLEPGETIFLPDVIAEFNTTGLGTLNVWTRGSALPLITTRVFNDLGAGGTLGFTEPMVRVEQALIEGDRVVFTTPSDFDKFRMNVGVRTNLSATVLAVRHRGPDGSDVTQFVTKNYPGDYVEQVSLQSFIGGPPAANGSVEIFVERGQVWLYTSTTDNKTNDSSITIVSRQN